MQASCLIRSFALASLLAAVNTSVAVPLFQPDSATAGSEFSGAYVITNTINGSAMPVNFCPASAHGTYLANNHWTTKSGALQQGTAFANFFFDEDQTIGTFLMWNHRSNGVASDPGYAVTLFDLRLYDADDIVLLELLDTPATPNVAISQAYRFGPIEGVRRVEFIVVANNGSPQYTGLAEVAFSEERYCPGDLNGDGVVDTADLGIVLGAFGSGDTGDLTCDSITDTDDLGALLGAFGTACN